MKAVIMAGGRGTRLRPLTCYLPKPMVPLLDRPCMEYGIDLLKQYGITDIAVTVQYLPQVIRTYFGDGTQLGVNLQFFEEIAPLGTAGSVKNAEDFLDETFVVISGDALTDFNLGDVIAFHRSRKALATIVLTKVDVPLDYGVVMTEENGLIMRFLEKPSWSEVFSDTVNTGIYVLEPEVLRLVAEGVEVDFGKQVFPAMLEQGLALYGCVVDGYWSDIGTLNQYRQTQFDMLMGLVDVAIKGEQKLPRVWIGEQVSIGAGCQIQGPSFIGAGTVIGANAKIGPYAVLGRYNQMESGVGMERAVVWNRTYVGKSSMLTGATLCSGVQIGAGVDIGEAAVVGEKSRVGELAVIRPGVKIWPEKAVGDGTIQQTSLIWGHSVFQGLFDEEGISGIPNIELIPEMAGRIASAYGSCLKAGAAVSVSCDEYPYCGVLKFSVISSLLAIGAQVRDIGVAPTPVARYECRRSNSAGGVHIRSSGEGDEKRIVLQFFDGEGLPIDKGTERKIENAFFQEDFSRPSSRAVGSFEQATKTVDFYIWEVLSRVRVDAIRSRRLKIVFQCDSAQITAIMQPILEQLGCQVVTVFGGAADIGAIVRTNAADVGITLDSSGQDFLFYSETGRAITHDELLILQMLMAVKEQGSVAMPVTAPSVVEELSEFAGISVVRTKAVLRSLLEISRVQPLQVHYDGFYSVVSLLQFLVGEGLSLQTIIAQFPQFHMSTDMVPCPVPAKGRVMRRLMEDIKGQRLELIDGIKILTDDGWALIMPDEDKALFKIVAQGSSRKQADELITLYKGKIASYRQA